MKMLEHVAVAMLATGSWAAVATAIVAVRDTPGLPSATHHTGSVRHGGVDLLRASSDDLISSGFTSSRVQESITRLSRQKEVRSADCCRFDTPTRVYPGCRLGLG